MPTDKSAVAPRSKAPVEVAVDWEALEDAFENNAPEVHSYLHLSTGEVLRVVDGIADPQMHSRIAADAAYVRVEPVSSREQYRWMERFIQMMDPGDLRDELGLAIDGRGAFRRFKDVLMVNAAERERWFAFRSERLRVFMEAWLEAHALAAVARPVPPPPAPESPSSPSEPAPASQAELGGRRTRNAEWLRRQLRDVATTLGARDLDRVLTFAEFVKARRVARNYSQRHESASGEELDGHVSVRHGLGPDDLASGSVASGSGAPSSSPADSGEDDVHVGAQKTLSS
jgi:Uncharacterised protein family (UPF0158)